MSEGEAGEARRRAVPKENSASNNVSFLLMENVLEKLKLLHYEIHYCEQKHAQPLIRTSFAMADKNPSVQFQSFVELVSWLCEEATNDRDTFRIDKFDDPNTSVNKMMLALRNMGFTLDFPVAKLKQGHGEAVCGVLDFLVDKCLDAKGFKWGQPQHEVTAEMEEAEVDEDADAGDIEDEIEVMEEEEAMFADIVEPEEEVLETSTQHIIENTIDPLLWKTELERVGPRLKANAISLGQEWRAHIEQTKEHEQTIRQVLPSAQGHMTAISAQIRDAVERMRTKEQSINNQFETVRSEYEVLRQEMKTIEEKYKSSNTNVEALTTQMARIQEQLEEIKSEMSGREQSATDTSPLVNIKHALQAIKTDVKTFDLRIGVVSHTLMQAKLRAAKGKHRRKNKQGPKDDMLPLDGAAA